jgi:hypothetical protein
MAAEFVSGDQAARSVRPPPGTDLALTGDGGEARMGPEAVTPNVTLALLGREKPLSPRHESP